MAIDYDSALDTIVSIAKTAWDTDTAAPMAAAGYPAAAPSLLYEETERAGKPDPLDGTEPFARVTVRHATGRAASLGNHRYRRTGTVYVQAFVPDRDGLSKGLAVALARVAQKAYEQSRGTAVSFKDVAVAEKGVLGAFYRADCTASFWWDEIR